MKVKKWYKVEYFKTLGKDRNQWHTIPGHRFEKREDAEEYAKKCERGFGKTRVAYTTEIGCN